MIAPGYMSLFRFPAFEVPVDSAHNVGVIKAVGEYISSLDVSRRVGISGQAGAGGVSSRQTGYIWRTIGQLYMRLYIRSHKKGPALSRAFFV